MGLVIDCAGAVLYRGDVVAGIEDCPLVQVDQIFFQHHELPSHRRDNQRQRYRFDIALAVGDLGGDKIGAGGVHVDVLGDDADIAGDVGTGRVGGGEPVQNHHRALHGVDERLT